ncbi:MAG: tetratricopeptide repeat protein, partial [Elusimicrobia bacterium]|nr:tetratricopeptide repeat protein [Elusimicrobiota bacterium]
NMLKGVPAGRRREYFTDLEKRSALAHEMSHAEDLLRSPYADGHDYINAGWTEGETKARLAELRVSPFSLAALCLTNKKYEWIREKIFGGFTAYEDTPTDEDIARLPAAEITKRAGEIYQRKIIGAGVDYWTEKAAAAASAEDKIRYYKWALEKWKYEDGVEKRAAALKNLADLRWEKGEYSLAVKHYAEIPWFNKEQYCGDLQTNKKVRDYLKTGKAGNDEKNVFAGAFAGCARHYNYYKADPEKAFRYSRSAVELSSASADGYLEWSWAYRTQKKYDKAAAILNRAIKAVPSDPRLYLARGQVYGEKGEFAKEIQDFDKAIALEPKNERTRIIKGMAYYDKGDLKKALETVSNDNKKLAAEYRTRAGNEFCAKRYEAALQAYNAAIALDTGSASAYFSRGSTYWRLAQYEKAANDYSKVLELDPTHTEARYSRGAIYNELKQYKKALVELNIMINLNPKHANAYNSLGVAYTGLKDYDKAIAYYKKSIELDARLIHPQGNLGIVYLRMHRYEDAKTALEKTLAMDSKHANTYASLGSYYWLGKQDKEKALQQYERAFKNGYSSRELLSDDADDDPLIKGLKDTPEFKALVEKYKKKPEELSASSAPKNYTGEDK